MQIVVKYRNHFVTLAIISGAVSAIMFWLVLRRTGFNTAYSRCTYLVMLGEYKQLLEPGIFPANPNLPPHLRLDRLSYLDLPTTEVALPPVIDVGLSDRDNIKQLEQVLPSTQRSDTHVHFGPIKTQTIVMTPTSNERYVRRRMGLSEKDKAQAMEDARRSQASGNS